MDQGWNCSDLSVFSIKKSRVIYRLSWNREGNIQLLTLIWSRAIRAYVAQKFCWTTSSNNNFFLNRSKQYFLGFFSLGPKSSNTVSFKGEKYNFFTVGQNRVKVCFVDSDSNQPDYIGSKLARNRIRSHFAQP